MNYQRRTRGFKRNEFTKHLTGESVLTGAILGSLAGLLVAATPVVLPGMRYIFGGPVVIFIGIVMGAVLGGILGIVVDLGISAGQIKKYKERIKGRMLTKPPINRLKEKML
jgi:hypothetical protein